jgi:hypothetical protein
LTVADVVDTLSHRNRRPNQESAMRTLLLMTVAVTVAWIGPASALLAQASPDAATMLAQMREASGGAAWSHVAEILEHGSMKENGFTGQRTQGEDLKTGNYAFTADFPAVKARIGSGVRGDSGGAIS